MIDACHPWLPIITTQNLTNWQNQPWATVIRRLDSKSKLTRQKRRLLYRKNNVKNLHEANNHQPTFLCSTQRRIRAFDRRCFLKVNTEVASQWGTLIDPWLQLSCHYREATGRVTLDEVAKTCKWYYHSGGSIRHIPNKKARVTVLKCSFSRECEISNTSCQLVKMFAS